MAMSLKVIVPPHPLIKHWLSILQETKYYPLTIDLYQKGNNNEWDKRHWFWRRSTTTNWKGHANIVNETCLLKKLTKIMQTRL